MRVAVYGGSFNPPHVGHAMVASWVYWTGMVDQVWLMPAFSHPFSKDLVSFEERMALCSALARDLGPWVEVTGIEQELPRPSYSIDSLIELRKRHSGVQFRFVIGADILPHTDEWKDWDTIENEFEPIVAGRYGYQNPAETVVFPGVSSSDIRRKARSGEDVSYLLTKEVFRLFLKSRPV